jgi:hypothetical protein
MSIHINRFVDRVRSAEHRHQRDFTMTLAEARELQADLIKLLLALHTSAAIEHRTNTNDPMEIDGGGF